MCILACRPEGVPGRRSMDDEHVLCCCLMFCGRQVPNSFVLDSGYLVASYIGTRGSVDATEPLVGLLLPLRSKVFQIKQFGDKGLLHRWIGERVWVAVLCVHADQRV